MPAPGGDAHVRPSRPRPAVCMSPRTTAPSAAPLSARAAATSFVDEISSYQITSRPSEPRRERVRASALAISSGSVDGVVELTSDRLYFKAQIGRGSRMGQRADRDVICTRLGQLVHPAQCDTA